MTITVETQLTRYTLEIELSHDEWMTLYRARRKADDRLVTIKVVAPLLATDDFFARRLKQVAGQVARLEHPHILPTYEAEEEDGLLYLVQNFAEGRTLEQVIESEGPLSLRRVQFIVRQLASALDYAHQKSVIHGDLSARTVFLGPDDRVRIADFGQAQLLFGANLAKQGFPGSSPQTLAPERVQGQGPSRYSDLYSLGILCYQMLVKAPPFTGPPSTVLHAQAYRQPRPLHRVNPGIPIAVSETIERMLSKGVELRYSTAAEFARALAMACRTSQTSYRYEGLPPLTEPERREWLNGQSLIYFASGLVIILLSVSLAIWAGFELGLKHARSQGPATQAVVAASTSPLQREAGPQQPDNLPPDDSQDLLPAPPRLRSSTTLLSTATPAAATSTLSDTLLPTPTPFFERFLPTPTTAPPTPRAALSPREAPPAPAVPAGQTLLIFTNPTGHDLIVDLTGPIDKSRLVSPYSQEEFSLKSGHYQLIVHTPTGNFLPSRTITFDLTEGQIAEKDYYTDFDPRELEQ